MDSRCVAKKPWNYRFWSIVWTWRSLFRMLLPPAWQPGSAVQYETVLIGRNDFKYYKGESKLMRQNRCKSAASEIVTSCSKASNSPFVKSPINYHESSIFTFQLHSGFGLPIIHFQSGTSDSHDSLLGTQWKLYDKGEGCIETWKPMHHPPHDISKTLTAHNHSALSATTRQGIWNRCHQALIPMRNGSQGQFPLSTSIYRNIIFTHLYWSTTH